MTHPSDTAEAVALTVSPQPKQKATNYPSSLQAEEHVIACILVDEGQTLIRAIQEGVTSASFYHPATSAIYRALYRLHLAKNPIALETLTSELGDELTQYGGFPYLFQITDKTPTTAHAGYFIQQLREFETRRDLLRSAIRIQDQIEAGVSAEEIELPPTVQRAGVTPKFIASRRVCHSAPPKEPQTRLYLADKPICTPGNITTVTSKAKQGKTAALGAATASIISASLGVSSLSPDTFKFRATNPNGLAVIVIDTEQSPFDAYTCYKRAMDRAGSDADPKWLYHYSFVGLSPEQVKQATDQAIAHAVSECHGIFVLILDGAADFVNSVNDEAECNGFVNWLRERTVTYDCPAICVIHSNEGVQAGDDGRGHLGKQLMRKAESNLLLKKTGEVTTITSEKQRKAPITDSDEVSFKWSDEAGRHISCQTAKEKKGGKKQHFLESYTSVFPSSEAQAKPFPQIMRAANTKKPISRNTFWSLVEEGVSTGEIQVNTANVNEPRYWVR